MIILDIMIQLQPTSRPLHCMCLIRVKRERGWKKKEGKKKKEKTDLSCPYDLKIFDRMKIKK